MLTVPEYASFDATGLANLLRNGDVTGQEVFATACAAAHAVGVLNAFQEGPWTEPLPSSPAGYLAGVPFVLKDILCHAQGVPVHAGSRSTGSGTRFDHDSILMSRFKAAGLSTIGTTRTPEFALSVSTEGLLGGPVHNPWNDKHTPGGSSGGTAALVAAGVVPVGHANDGAGSIRIPASHSGLVGLKPSRGRIPIGPGVAEVMYGNAVEFAVTRSVRDSAVLLDLTHGNVEGEKYAAPQPSRPFIDELEPSARQLRVAIVTQSWSSLAVDHDVLVYIDRAAKAIEAAGHVVESAAPIIDWERLSEAVTTTWCAGAAAAVVPANKLHGSRDLSTDDYERTTIACATKGEELTLSQLASALDTYNSISRRMAQFMRNWDIVVCPTAVHPAPLLGYSDANRDYSAEEWVRHCLDPYPAGVLYNITGAPAMNVPIGLSSAGLPIGVQLGARNFREDLIFQVAKLLEDAFEFSQHTPSHHVSSATERQEQ